MIYYLLFLTIILSYLFCDVESFVPLARSVHSSVLVENNRLYFFGGEINGSVPVNEVFYLDVSQEFNAELPPWTDLTASAAIPFRSSWAGVSVGKINKNPIIYLFGGFMLDINSNRDSFTSLLHTFNITSQQWSIAHFQETPALTRRRNLKSIIDDSGNIYIFGGYYVVNTEPLQEMFNDMIIINTNTLSLSFGSTQNSPSQRCGYTATLLPNGIIVYVGGYKADGNSIVNINDIFLYNTKYNSWSFMVSNNINSIESRYLHSAVLAPDGRIIIYGGFSDALGQVYVKVSPDLIILDTNTFPYEWTIPQVSSMVGNVPSLAGHSADLVGDYMIVAFGNITRYDAPPVELNSNIFLLNLMNNTWVNRFEPKITYSHQNSDNTNNHKIIAISCGVAGVAIIIMAGSFFAYKRYKRRKRNEIIIRIPSEKRSYEQKRKNEITLKIPDEKRSYEQKTKNEITLKIPDEKSSYEQKKKNETTLKTSDGQVVQAQEKADEAIQEHLNELDESEKKEMILD